MPRPLILAALLSAVFQFPLAAAEPTPRRPKNDEELRFWLDNMLVHHRFSAEEAAAATGLSAAEVTAAAERWKIDPAKAPARAEGAPLLVLPYPGGRHPRIGFLDGAVDPQRETKVSVFAPWKDGGYAVADVPEAIWMEIPGGRELLYLAHTHVATHWTKQGVTLEPLEWRAIEDCWQMERTLPNKVAFGARVTPQREGVKMEMWLTNGRATPLKGLVVQNCVMLKGLAGFAQQTNDNKLFRAPLVACSSADKTRWIITAWTPNHRTWGNAPCPCLHSDPKFPDCEPGKTVRLRGWLSFYEGADIEGELTRLGKLDWLQQPSK
ncbi:MAG TPA: hypothetical protein VFB80_05625 [Pirellulaceae bacterium]|nr:hypothetical protein [Pirellulaceae bacterium]